MTAYGIHIQEQKQHLFFGQTPWLHTASLCSSLGNAAAEAACAREEFGPLLGATLLCAATAVVLMSPEHLP